MRVPPSPLDETSDNPVVRATVARRGGSLIDLDRALFHSLTYASGWNSVVGAIRGDLALSVRLRELAMYAVAALHGSQFEQGVHAPLYLQAGGSAQGLQAADRLARVAPAGLPADETAVLNYVLAMTRDVRVPDAVFAAVKTALNSDQQLVELTGVISTFNMVTRFILALEIFP